MEITVIIPEESNNRSKLISKSIQGPAGPRGPKGDSGDIAAEVSKVFSYNDNGTINTITKGTTLYTFNYNPNGTLNTITSGIINKEFIYDSNEQLIEIIVENV